MKKENFFRDSRLHCIGFRYQTAKKEIEALAKLEELKWNGIPKLYGACITPNRVTYAVSLVEGKPLCEGVGNSTSCLMAKKLIKYIVHTTKPTLTTLIYLHKVSKGKRV